MTRIEDRTPGLDQVIDSLIHGPAPAADRAEDELADTARLLRDGLSRLQPLPMAGVALAAWCRPRSLGSLR